MFDHLHAFLGQDLAASGAIIVLPLFVAGLAGGFTHCAGMCGPFVLAQVAGRLSRVEIASFGPIARLGAAALVPYHLGRLTTYTLLGFVAGGFADSASLLTEHAWIPAIFLLLSALLFFAQAIGRPLGLAWLDRELSNGAGAMMRLLHPLLQGASVPGGYLLGVALGFLPCGMLYGALAASVGCGTAAVGAAGMAAFALGTFPALFAVGFGGVVLGERRRAQIRKLVRPAMALNAVLLASLAVVKLAA